MKILIIPTLLLISLSCFSQINTVEATIEEDEFTGNKWIETDLWDRFAANTNGTNLSAYFQVNFNGAVQLRARWNKNLGCFIKYESTLEVKLVNGTIVEFVFIDDTFCSDYESVVFAPLPSESNSILENLQTYDWEMIRITSSSKKTDFKPNPLGPYPLSDYEFPEQFFRLHISAMKAKQ